MCHCCPVVELRQYTLKPGQRDVLVDLFDRYFIESQEAQGMTVIGQFRDRRRSDRFVWLRGFADMEGRRRALEAFYGGPVWATHKNDANDTMLDSDDVLLLKPARPDLAFRMVSAAAARAAHTRPGPVLAGIYHMPQAIDRRLVSEFEQTIASVLQKNHLHIEGVFVTESAKNTFPRLPVREGEHVLAWFATAAGDESSPETIDPLVREHRLRGQTASLLVLDPTPRSILGGGPHAARATKHDFDFLSGSWTVHNRYLEGRLRQSSDWIEFGARADVEPLLNGFGQLFRYAAVREGASVEGIGLRLFDPDTGEWQIHWADTVRARTLLPPMVGRFVGDVGEFFGHETVDGRDVLCRFRWTGVNTGAPRWEQAFSGDRGRTWETNWIMTFTRP